MEKIKALMIEKLFNESSCQAYELSRTTATAYEEDGSWEVIIEPANGNEGSIFCHLAELADLERAFAVHAIIKAKNNTIIGKMF